MELTINGTDYQYCQQYLKEDGLWECAYVDVHGNMSEVDSGKLISYVEVLSVAKKELEKTTGEKPVTQKIFRAI